MPSVSYAQRKAAAFAATITPSYYDLSEYHEISSDVLGPADIAVLIRGETGTGKEVLARKIHLASGRSGQPFIAVNCAAIPATVFESEFFGYLQGAFTGAQYDYKGYVQQANGGTLFLDEIGELALPLQIKLLRLLQEKEYIPLGSTETLKANVRIIAATNIDIKKAIRAGKLREDLYHRLNHTSVTLKPLREMPEHIVPLAESFLTHLSEKYPLMNARISLFNEVKKALLKHPWPGNIRELENTMERAFLLSQKSSYIFVEHLNLITPAPPAVEKEEPEPTLEDLCRNFAAQTIHTASLETILRTIKTQLIDEAMDQNYGDIKAAARDLSVLPRSLLSHFKDSKIKSVAVKTALTDDSFRSLSEKCLGKASCDTLAEGFEAAMVLQSLQSHSTMKAAAKALHMTPRNLRRHIEFHAIDKDSDPPSVAGDNRIIDLFQETASQCLSLNQYSLQNWVKIFKISLAHLALERSKGNISGAGRILQTQNIAYMLALTAPPPLTAG